MWSKPVDIIPSPKHGYDLRQIGPFRAIFQDEPPIWTGERSPGSSRGAILDWRNGTVTQFDDGTFATIEDSAGLRITSPEVSGVFDRAQALQVDHDHFAAPDALTARDASRAFIVIRNGSSGLAGIDLSTWRVSFLVPLAVGAGRTTVEIASGFVIVRTQSQSNWRATIHDPITGRVLYRATR